MTVRESSHSTNFKFLIVSLLLCIVSPALGRGETFSDPEYLIDSWETDQGLPEDSATAMVQTPDGYLWFGTFNGLVRFDGVKFTVFDRSNTPELPSAGIVNLHLDRSGRLWVSTLLGMAYLKDGQWRVFLHDSGWAGNYVRFFAESASGQLYAADWDGRIFKFKEGGFEELPPPPANPKLGFVLHVDEDGNLWAVNPQFIGRLVEGKWQQMIPAADLLKQDPGGLSPWIIAGSSSDGGLWIATRQHLRKYRGGRLAFETRPPWPMEGFWSLHEDSEGNVWICSWKSGLYRFSRDGGWRRFSSTTGLSYHATRFVFEDREGNWWIGTYGGGLDRFKRRHLNNWGLAQGLPERSIKSVTADRQGRIVMATFGQGVVRLEGKKINWLLRPGATKDIGRFVQATLVDHAGRLWVGTLSDGLVRMDNTARPAFFDDPDHVAVKQILPAGPTRTEGSIYSLFEDSHGSVWAGANGGGIQFYKDRSKKYGIEGAPFSSIRSFAEDPASGTLWAGAIGLYRLNGERFAPVPEAKELANVGITSLLADKDGTLWIGTEDRGIARLRNGRLARISEPQGLPARSIGSIVDDDLGSLWFGTTRGILRIARSDLESVIQGQNSSLNFQVFDQSDGMESLECSISYQPTAVRDRDGKLWFATFKGVAAVDPRNLPSNAEPPPLAIEQVLIDGEPATGGGQLLTSMPQSQVSVTVPPGDHRLEIHYAGLSYTAPEKVRFRYMQEGLDKEWVDVGDRRVAYLRNLKPGHYRFLINAANNGGAWSQPGSSLQLDWRPHFYQTYWFLGMCALGFVLTGTGAYRLRTQRFRARALALERIVDERTRQLREYKEHLEEQVAERTSELTSANLQLRQEIADRRQGEVALRESEERFRTLYEDTPSMYFTVDPSGRVRSVNEFGAAQLGYVPEELVGKPVLQVFLEEDQAAAAQQLSQCVANPGQVFHWELRKVHRNGQILWVKETARAVPNRAGQLVVMVVCEDITELKKLEEQLRQAHKMEAVGTLSGGIAHDFNNLLTVIKGYSRMLLDGAPDPGTRTHVERIDEAAERAASLTAQLLAFSRRQVLQPKVFSLNTLVLNMDKMLRRLIGEDIEIVTVTTPDLGSVKADPGQIEQVIMNLVVNARDAMPKGGKLTLETANVDLDENYVRQHPVVRAGSYIMLAVSDTGIGMDPETQARIFEPFFTTKALGKGTGLGLSMVYGIVKQSGGNIWVYSEPGRGTTFKVYLPRMDAPVEGIEGGQRPAAEVGGHETILLVEDDPGVRDLARTVLTAYGYSVLVADATSTVSSFCQDYAGPIHLLLTDVVMPGRGGRELARDVVARRPAIKVLYMSGYTTNAIVHHGELDAETFFLPKPFTPSSLARKVREVLDHVSATSEV